MKMNGGICYLWGVLHGFRKHAFLTADRNIFGPIDKGTLRTDLTLRILDRIMTDLRDKGWLYRALAVVMIRADELFAEFLAEYIVFKICRTPEHSKAGLELACIASLVRGDFKEFEVDKKQDILIIQRGVILGVDTMCFYQKHMKRFRLFISRDRRTALSEVFQMDERIRLRRIVNIFLPSMRRTFFLRPGQEIDY